MDNVTESRPIPPNPDIHAVLWDPICAKTLKERMDEVEEVVQNRIRLLLSEKPLGLVFDAWTEASTHYIAVIAVTPNESKPYVADKYLLYFSPFEDETSMNADAFIDLFDHVLDTYQIDAKEQLCFVTCDHAPVNGALATRAQVPMLGCASHRFQLAVARVLARYDHLLSKVQALMVSLNTVKNRARLRLAKLDMPVQRNATRWSSTFDMIDRYLSWDGKNKAVDPSLVDLLPSPREDLQLKKLFGELKRLESVSKRLQADDSDPEKKDSGEAVSLDGVRKLFDGVMKRYDVTSEYLSPHASIVHSPEFETAVVKVISGKESRLTRDEADLLYRFERREEASSSTDAVSFADECLRRPVEKSRYMDLRWIPATSNEVERLFSKAGQVLTTKRQAMHPTRLETLLFLEYNKRLWDVIAVSTAIHRIEARKRQRREQVSL